MRIELHHHLDEESARKLDDILRRLIAMEGKETQMTADLTRLRADVARNTDLLKSAEQTLSGIAQQLRDALAGPNPQADIDAIATQLENDDAGLAAAITENTPAATGAPTPAASGA